MGRASIETKQYNIKEIFSDNFVFSIPRYQRSYAWTTEEAGMLLEDLLAAMEESAQDPEEPSAYFLGSIVLTKGDKPDSEVIDGQQRLTTITILLAALRASIRPEKAKGLEKFLYEEANTFVGTPGRYRLTLRKRDADFFQKYIQAENGIKSLSTLPPMVLSESQRNIRDNALVFMQRLRHLSEVERIRLGEFLVLNCFVVVVSTYDFDTAYRIFSVLNNRGRNLSYADLLKAQVISDIPDAEQDEYTNKWEEIEVLLGSEQFQDLLTLIRVLSPGPRMRKNLREEFRAHVYPNGQMKMTAQQLIDLLLYPYGHILHAINTASYKEASQHAAEIEALLRWLNRLSHNEWLPAALQYWRRNQNDPALLLRFLRALDRLSVGLLLLNMSHNKRTERYYQLQVAIKNNHNKIYESSSPLQLTDDEQREIYRTLNGNLYENVSVSVCKYILLRLDTLLSEGTASYELPTISVEHVLPQKPQPNSEWTKWFPGDLHKRYLHRLGNLVLLSKQKNHDANNYDFAKKKAVYFSKQGASPFVLTSQVINTREWTPDAVQKRQHDLVNKLAHYWNIASPPLQVVKRA
jgi:Protein of unknown function DUF262/Protein of unknown function (DUF1524)